MPKLIQNELLRYRLVETALGRVYLAGLLQFSNGLGYFLGVHAKDLGDITGTDRFARFLHCFEDLIFHDMLLHERMCMTLSRVSSACSLSSMKEQVLLITIPKNIPP